MQFTFHQLISLVAITGGSISLYTGIAGKDVLLYLCGVAIVLAATVPNRKVDIDLDLKGFKFGMRILPDNKADPTLHRKQVESSEQSQENVSLCEEE